MRRATDLGHDITARVASAAAALQYTFNNNIENAVQTAVRATAISLYTRDGDDYMS